MSECILKVCWLVCLGTRGIFTLQIIRTCGEKILKIQGALLSGQLATMQCTEPVYVGKEEYTASARNFQSSGVFVTLGQENALTATNSMNTIHELVVCMHRQAARDM